MEAPPNLASLHGEVLKEVGNIGAGHAASSLAQILKSKVGLTQTTVTRYVFGTEPTAEEDRRDVIGVRMAVLGQAPGDMVLLFDRDEAFGFAKRFLTVAVGDMEIGEEYVGATLLEIANIIGGSYLSALADLIHRDMLPSTPSLMHGKIDDIYRTLSEAAEDPSLHRELFVTCNGFINERGIINVRLAFLPRDASLHAYLEAFGLQA